MKKLKLIKKARQGDKISLIKILKNFNNQINFSIRKFFIVADNKEDTLQEAKITFFKAINDYKFNKRASLKTFTTPCIRRYLISIIKNSNAGKNKILNSVLSISYEKNEFNYEYYNYPKITGNYSVSKEIYKALIKYIESNLSPMEKNLLEYIILEISYIEIAEKTGRSSKSIDNAIQRIRKKFLIFFKEYEIN